MTEPPRSGAKGKKKRTNHRVNLGIQRPHLKEISTWLNQQ